LIDADLFCPLLMSREIGTRNSDASHSTASVKQFNIATDLGILVAMFS